MFCSKCGAENTPTANFCYKCGAPLSNEIARDSVEPVSKNIDVVAPAIWGPSAAAFWSLLFSPVFGTYIQTLNWRTLGESERAKSSRRWFYASLLLVVLLVIAMVCQAFFLNWFDYLFLLIWYFASGRKQSKYVKEKFKNIYPRKSWRKPFLIALGIHFVGFVALLIALRMSADAAVLSDEISDAQTDDSHSVAKDTDTQDVASPFTLIGKYSYEKDGFIGEMIVSADNTNQIPGGVVPLKVSINTMILSQQNLCDFEAVENTDARVGSNQSVDASFGNPGDEDSKPRFEIVFSPGKAVIKIDSQGGVCGLNATYEGRWKKEAQ